MKSLLSAPESDLRLPLRENSFAPPPAEPASVNHLAVSQATLGTHWQRYRLTFTLSIHAGMPKRNAELAVEAIRIMFVQSNAANAVERVEVTSGVLGQQVPKIKSMVFEATKEKLAFTAFPQVLKARIWSTNLWETPVRSESLTYVVAA